MLVFGTIISHAQVRYVKPVVTHSKRTTFGIGAGMTRSVLFLSRNINDDNDATGFNFNAVYGISRLMRLNAEYTFYRPLDIAPTWLNIRARTLEVNMHFIARLTRSKAFFYPIFGISYNVFNGYFTGKNDFFNLASKYPVNRRVITRWVGLNVGTGYEHYIKPVSIFIDYKMRAGVSDEQRQFNIIDVCFSAGLRYNLRVRSIYSIYKGTRGRYFLDSED
jgi:hypothetical protein